MPNSAPDVIGIGAASWDRFLVVPRYPEPDEKVRAIRTEECAGGMVATALVALERWGLHCRYVGVLGRDEFSDRIVDDLKREGVNEDSLIRREDADGRRTIILVDNRTGRRSIISGPHRVPPIQPDALNPDMFAQARVLHLDTSVDDCGVEAATMAKKEGLWVVLDAERLQKRTVELMKRCDYVIATRAFAEECTKQTTLDLAAYGLHILTGRPIIVTDGEHGCEYASEDLSFHQPAFEVPVVDSTGAGDVFHAAFIYGLLSAWEPRKTIRFAAWAGAMACRELGGRKGIPSLAAVRDFSHNDH